MFALLPVFKPRGMSSRRAVDVLEAVFDGKVGHAGTLDPLASGVLVLAIGPATRLVPYVQQMPKRYTALFQLGVESASDDSERPLEAVPIDRIPEPDELSETISQFVGKIKQTPPAFSAVKVAGKRAYRLAHRGYDVQIRPRQVDVHSIRVVQYEFPYFEIDVCCSSGTYIRTLGRDIAARWSTKSVMVDLCRTAIGPFDLKSCATLDEIRGAAFTEKLVDPLRAFAGIPVLALEESRLALVAQGVKYEHREPATGGEILLTDQRGRLHAVLRPAPDGKWRPALNFSKYWRGERNAWSLEPNDPCDPDETSCRAVSS
jgi:tRNA pseudouridine55 synthase